jgi:hypothetical protein
MLGDSLSERFSHLLHVSKVLEGLNFWLRSMNDASASDVVVGETPEKPAEALSPVRASARLQSGAIVGIFALLGFTFSISRRPFSSRPSRRCS